MPETTKIAQLYDRGHHFLREAELNGGNFLFVPRFAYSIARKCVIQSTNERILITNPKIDEIGMDVIEYFARPHPDQAFKFANRVFNPVLAVRIARIGASEPQYIGSSTSFEVLDLATGFKLVTEQKLMAANTDEFQQNILRGAQTSTILKSLQNAVTQVPSPDYLDELATHITDASLKPVSMYDLAIDDQPRRPYPVLP